MAIVPVVTALIAWRESQTLNGILEAGPFRDAICPFLLSDIGITVSLWPMIVIHVYALCDAESVPETGAFPLIGTVVLLPVVLLYTG